MIAPLNKLEGDNLDTAIKALNNKFHAHGFLPVRFTFSEFRNIADYLKYNSDDWSFLYADSIMSRFNYAEVTFIKRLSKAIDNPEELKQIQYDIKIANNATRRIVYDVLKDKNEKQSVKDKLMGVFKNVNGH